ncbi:alternative oxidase [Lasallia pustulata]|uniref:Alternative oxidase n=1 Tax=Lasallia pustulata TaxID=136370 RepID=A0A1W5DA22_9LECA|nr:alternative oxidase [Lasallia pustulata]
MYPSLRTSSTLALKQGKAQISHAVFGLSTAGACQPTLFHTTRQNVQHHALPSTRQFTSTARNQLKEFFPPPTEAPHVKRVKSAWGHPVYTKDQTTSISIAHRETKTWSDWVALSMVRLLRFGMNTATGYRHDHAVAEGVKDPTTGSKKSRYAMNERKWLVRFVFLESVAGVPGMVGGVLRHLRSMRKLKRDNGWIETLLEEAYNERMHLLTFLKLAEPGWFMKFMILGAQGVFFNAMFFSYLISPRTCHRFVGYLEEEAVITYTRAIADIDAGKLPKWQSMEAPDIAVRYWKMPEDQRTMRDLLLYIRADEAKHREVNHTLGNLKQDVDPNPYASVYDNPSKPHPSKGIQHMKPTGWERQEVI